MRGKKTDIQTKAKIVEKKVSTNAQGSVIAEELGIPIRTVNHIIDKEFAEICQESDKIAELVDRNNRLQSLADKMIQEKLEKGEETIKVSELVSLRQSTFTQNQLITGGATQRISFDSSVVDALDKLLGE